MKAACDVLVVGGGPAGLACAAEMRRLRPDWQVWLLEKGARIGAHMLSGAVLQETDATRRFFADAAVLPGAARVARDRFAALTHRGWLPFPWVPPPMRQRGRVFLPLPSLAAAMEKLSSAAGVEVFCAQAAWRLLWNGDRVAGVLTGSPAHPEEIPVARAVVLAEGPAGVLAREAQERLPALRPAAPQRYSLGLKRVYRVSGGGGGGEATTLHTFGHPLPARQFGGGFVYSSPGRIDAGFVAALEPEPLRRSPREAFREFLAHPKIAVRLHDAKPVAYGARLLPERGWHALPASLSDGGAWLVGDAAGLLDPFTLKGIHLAIESGVAAAASIAEERPLAPADLPSVASLRRSRAYRDGFAGGLLPGILTAGLSWATRGILPPSRKPKPIPPASTVPSAPVIPSPDPTLDADLYLSHLAGPQLNGPSHIALRDPALCRDCPAPCLRFCPAAVYAASSPPSPPVPPLIRHENCLHCRTCLVACPRSNLLWTPPHGGPDFAENG